MYDRTADVFLPALKFVPDWFTFNKMLENLGNVVFSNGDVYVDDIDSDTVTFFSNALGLPDKDLNNINLDDNNFDKDDPVNVALVKLIT